MLKLTIHDGDTDVVLEFEHSLLSLSKWESKYKKPFLGPEPKQGIEMIRYFEEMIVTPGADTRLVYALEPEQHKALVDYINDPMTASSVRSDQTQRSSGERVTSELIYYWMTALKINWVAESWHLNRLMMLIQITNVKQQSPDKKRRPDSATMADWRALNAQRKAKMNSSG